MNNKLFLKSIITEGPDAGYGYVVTLDDFDHNESQFAPGYKTQLDNYLKTATPIDTLVHPSYLENHKVGWLPDDWEEGYEVRYKQQWVPGTKEKYDEMLSIYRRKVIIPHTAPVEDAGGDWHYDYKFIKDLTYDLSQQENCEGLSMEEVEAVLLKVGYTHPLHVEDKRECGKFKYWTVDDVRKEVDRLWNEYHATTKGLNEKSFRLGLESGLYRHVAFVQEWTKEYTGPTANLTTPPTKEGERVEKDEVREALEWALSYLRTYQEQINSPGLDGQIEFAEAALATPGKDEGGDAVEFLRWCVNEDYNEFDIIGPLNEQDHKELYRLFKTKPQSK